MRASTNELADDDDGVRASDSERDLAIDTLRDRFAEGRLSHETFLYRMDAALHAKDRSGLAELFTDLPAADLPGAELSAARSRRKAGQWLSQWLSARQAARRPARRAMGNPAWQPFPIRPMRPRQARVQPWPAPMRPEPTPLRLPPQAGHRFTIGRAASCDFTIDDERVSRWHARLERRDDGWLICDLGSTNGTRLNGWRVKTEAPLRPGDELTLGGVTFVVTDQPEGTGSGTP